MTFVYQCEVIICATFLTGQAGNLVIQRLAKQQTGFDLNYTTWMLGGIVPSLVSIVVTGLLLALSLVPHNLMSYDAFLLFLVCRRGRDTIALVVLGWIAAWYVNRAIDPVMAIATMQQQFPIPVVALLYLPALVLVLMRTSPPTFQRDPECEPGQSAAGLGGMRCRI